MPRPPIRWVDSQQNMVEFPAASRQPSGRGGTICATGDLRAMASSATTALPGPGGHASPHDGPPGETRRDFLNLVTGSFVGLGVIAVAWAMVDSMNPSADVIAAGAPMDLDIS